MKALEKDNLLFISFEQAARGHRLARVLASLPNVYWFSHPANGYRPWNISNRKESTIAQRKISGFHYNRLMPTGKMLPPPYDYVSKYIKDKHHYYTDTFEQKFLEAGGHDIPNNVYIPYCTHSLPGEIREYFPNAKIINIVHDPMACVNRYMKVGINFPGYVRHPTVVDESNEYLQWLTSLQFQKPDLKVKDVWALEHHGVMFEESMMEELAEYKLEFFKERRKQRMMHIDHNVLNTANVRSYSLFKKFINDEIKFTSSKATSLNLDYEVWTQVS